MSLPKILVTGATGKSGGALVVELLQKDWPVRAVVHKRDKRSERLEQLGAEVAVANLYDPEQLLAAMRGTARAYYCPPSQPYMVQSAAAFAAAAKEAKLESIVQMGQWLSSPSHPALLTRQTWLIDRLFATIPGVAHTVVNPGWFADNALRLMDFAALLGIYPVLTGESRSAPVANEDIARVVAAVLADPKLHAGKTYRPTGPKLLSGHDVANIIQQVIGTRVRAFNMPLWMLYKAANQQGVTAFEMSGFRHYVEEHRRGTFELFGGVSDDVLELTGRPPENFQTTVRRYAALPFARQSLANRLRAVYDFLRVPFHPGFNLDRYDREQLHPVASQPRLSIDDPEWNLSHGAQMAASSRGSSTSIKILQSDRPFLPAIQKEAAR